jgi:aldehyde:ferredoxin oxidoreductase
MLDNYYKFRGWDKNTGIPTRETLENLGLTYVADELEKLGKKGEHP